MSFEAEPPLVLLVEFDERLARVLISCLEHDGHRVVHVDSLAAAAPLLASSAESAEPSGLLLIDLDGIPPGEQEAALGILAGRPGLLLASEPARAGRGEGRAGIIVLRKPFSIRALRRKITALVGSGADQE